MNSVKQFTWEVVFSGSPLLKRKCTKCNHPYFYNSGKFRLNSQKKLMDVWLIYKCENCDNTQNITVLSRTKPDLIHKELYQKFMDNDIETAYRTALIPEIVHKNNMQFDLNTVEYEILCEKITLEDIAQMEEEKVEFFIKSAYPVDIKISHVIRKCFDLSATQLEKLSAQSIITISQPYNLKKSRLKDGIIITIHKDKLIEYMSRK